MANLKNEPRKQKPRRKERRQKRSKREDDRSRSGPAVEQRDREEDAPQPPMPSGNDDEP